MSTTIRSLLTTATQSQTPLHSTQVLQTPISVIPTLQPVEARITIVAIVTTCCLLVLITVLLILILYLIALKMKSQRLKQYANFPNQYLAPQIPVERVIEHIVEDSKYNPIYVSDSIRGRDSYCDNNAQLQGSLRPGQAVQANQDYFQPGREMEGPIFLKGDTILVRKVEGDAHKGQNMVWLRGEVAGREVCFPSYVINIVDTLEDTFDTFSTPLRRPDLDECAAQDSAVSMDSAPAELESLFHDVDFSLTQHSNVLPLSSRQEQIKQRHYSHSDISYAPHIRPMKRPTRRPPVPPKDTLQLPSVPSKLNRPKLSSKKEGSKGTDELLFVPPPLSSSTPLRYTGPKSRPKRTRGIIHKRPDTPNAKINPKSKIDPPSRKGRVPSWVLPMEPPSRPEPPYTPSTLSLILFAGTQDEPPVKPPPPTTYESTNMSN